MITFTIISHLMQIYIIVKKKKKKNVDTSKKTK